MDLLQLKYFITAARLCNITKAAKVHRIAQPAMSQTISKLEKELRCNLFKRSHNKIQLTDEGQIFFEKIEKAIRLIDEAKESLESENVNNGEITLLVLQHRNTVVECVSSFKKLYPKVRFNIIYNSDRNLIFDLCVTSGDNLTPPMKKEFLIREKLILAISTCHEFSSREKISIKELKNEKLVFTSPQSSVLEIVQKKLDQYNIKIKPSIYMDDIMCVLRFTKSNLGCAIVPEVSWTDMLRDNLSLVEFEEKDIYRDTYLIWDGDRSLSKTTVLFRDYLKEHFYNIAT